MPQSNEKNDSTQSNSHPGKMLASDVNSIHNQFNTYKSLLNALINGRITVSLSTYHTKSKLISTLQKIELNGSVLEGKYNAAMQVFNSDFYGKLDSGITPESIAKLDDTLGSFIQSAAKHFDVTLDKQYKSIVDVKSMVPLQFRKELDKVGFASNKLGTFYCEGKDNARMAMLMLCGVDVDDKPKEDLILNCRERTAVVYDPQSHLVIAKDLAGNEEDMSAFSRRKMTLVAGFKATEKLGNGEIKDSYFTSKYKILENTLSRHGTIEGVTLNVSPTLKSFVDRADKIDKSTNAAAIDNHFMMDRLDAKKTLPKVDSDWAVDGAFKRR